MEFPIEFIHAGVRHKINDTNHLTALDQGDYAAARKSRITTHMSKHTDDDRLNETLNACFLTLLGAAAWLLQTRMGIAIYVSALPCVSHIANITHLKLLNCPIMCVQRHPQAHTHKPLKLLVCLIVFGDSA